MARLQIAPTKSNLLAVKEQLAIAKDGYELLEQKREILVMELMQMVEKVKLLESDIDKQIAKAYPSLRRMFMAVTGRQNRFLRFCHSRKTGSAGRHDFFEHFGRATETAAGVFLSEFICRL